MALTVMTWNLKGSEQPDPAVVVQHADAMHTDVLLLQEVQRHQARAIARGLGAASLRWGFKHWPVRTWPEGMAVIGVSRPLVAHCHPLTRRWQPWSWRRRIVLTARLDSATSPVAADGGSAAPVHFANLHLSPGKVSARRAREIVIVFDLLAPTAESSSASSAHVRSPTVIAGDLNARPDAALFDVVTTAGLHDAWTRAHPDQPEVTGATNWSSGRKGNPRQRIDYVLVSDGIEVLEASVPRPEDEDFERFRTLSDHLPLTVTVDL